MPNIYELDNLGARVAGKYDMLIITLPVKKMNAGGYHFLFQISALTVYFSQHFSTDISLRFKGKKKLGLFNN